MATEYGMGKNNNYNLCLSCNPYPAETESDLPFCLCHQYRVRAACTDMQSDQALYCWLANFIFSSWCDEIPKNDNGLFQNWKMGYSRNSAGYGLTTFLSHCRVFFYFI